MKVIKMILQFLVVLSLVGCSSKAVDNDIDSEGGDDNGSTTFTLEGFKSAYVFSESDSKVQDRVFYWATLVEKNALISQTFQNNEALSTFLLNAKKRLNAIESQNNVTGEQLASTLKFSETDRVLISTAVKKTVENNPKIFIDFSNSQCGPSGAFNRFQEVNDVARFHQLIVEELLIGVNQIIDTYAAGKDPKYPDLDRISFDAASVQYKLLLKNLVSGINSNKDKDVFFYQPFLKFAIGIMAINNRDEAGRFIPLKSGENASAFQNIPNIEWDKYKYSMLAVLGDAPNSPGDLPNISIGGMKRCDYAVTLYNQGLAPLIALSGGNIAPFQTEYNEAVEMKKYIMEKHGISETAILIDPHARHTTTNLRNIGRLIFRYGIPTDKKALLSTTSSQSDYVSSDRFSSRCMNEMRHVPMVLHVRISQRDIEFTPKIEVLHLDSTDPLDP